MTDLVIAFALMTPIAFGAVWSLFGVLSWVEERLEDRSRRMNSDWLQPYRGGLRRP